MIVVVMERVSHIKRVVFWVGCRWDLALRVSASGELLPLVYAGRLESYEALS